jgi:hypothetical protein
VWFFQPLLNVPNTPPFISQPIGGEPSPILLLEQAVKNEAHLRPPEEAPVFFLLPEFSLNRADIPTLRRG